MRKPVFDKKTPTYDLASFRLIFSSPEKLVATLTAVRDAQALGFNRSDMVAALQAMRRQHFYKSMTSHADHTVWQDVYHVPFRGLVLYVKFTADRITEFKLLSFKER